MGFGRRREHAANKIRGYKRQPKVVRKKDFPDYLTMIFLTGRSGGRVVGSAEVVRFVDNTRCEGMSMTGRPVNPPPAGSGPAGRLRADRGLTGGKLPNEPNFVQAGVEILDETEPKTDPNSAVNAALDR